MPGRGFRFFPAFLDPDRQLALGRSVAAALRAAPPFRPAMPKSGKPFSVMMSNCGPLGWLSDRAGGYRYQATHPETGRPWPAIPAMLLEIWSRLAFYPAPPQACLINLYDAGARMGAHQDRDEADLTAPVLSISLGDSAVFAIGGSQRGGKMRRVTLASGDLAILDGDDRLAFHGIDRLLPGSSRLPDRLAAEEPIFGAIRRINLTLRRVTAPTAS